MKKIEYRDIDGLQTQYLDAFQGWCHRHQPEWSNLRMDVPDLQVFPDLLSDILIAKIESLVNWYYQYTRMNINGATIDKIKAIFKYKGQNQSRISGFFMDHAEELEIGTCHYCDTAYINVYHTGKRNRNHFDIDHFLPKSKCPITTLSLFNLVPSCPVCNERLKGNHLLSENENETIMLSPTSDKYEFDERVKIQVMPLKAYPSIHYMDNLNKFKVLFHTDSEEYKRVIDVFKLDDRYDFHKCEALRLLDLLQDYPESHIAMIANILGKNPNRVREDIFCNYFVDQNRRVFAKLHRDVINQYTEINHYK